MLCLGTGTEGRFGLEYEIDDASSRDVSNRPSAERPFNVFWGKGGMGFMDDGMIGTAAEGGRGMASGRFDKWGISICSGATNTGRKGSILYSGPRPPQPRRIWVG